MTDRSTRNLSRRYLSGLVAALVVLAAQALFSGCGGGEEKSGEEGNKITIRIAHWWGDQQDLWKEVIAEFEKSHPDIHVEQQVLSFDVHVQKVLTSSAAGSGVGDLILLEDWFAQELLGREFLVDIRPMIARDLNDSDYFPVSLETFRQGESVRAFPVALGSYPLLYNRDLFDSAGVSYPDSTWTYDTLLAAAAKLTKDTDGDGKPDRWGFLLDNSGGFDGLLYSMGGAVLTDDLKRSAFNEPRTLNALRFWVDLVHTYRVSPEYSTLRGGTSSGGALRPFETGKYGMSMLGSFLTTYRNNRFRWDIALPPSGPAGRKALRFAAAFGIPKSSEHPDAAWEFLRWIVEEMPANYADRIFYGLVPNSRRLAGSPEYLEGEPKVNRRILIDLIEHHSFSYWRSGWREFRDQGFLPELELMMSGAKSVEQGAADADKLINAVLDRANH